MADAEGVISELKPRGTLARARCRGTPLFHVQVLVDCAAGNLKRLADHAGEAVQGRAAGPATGAMITLAAAHRAYGAPDGRVEAVMGDGTRVETASGASTAATWSFAVSLN